MWWSVPLRKDLFKVLWTKTRSCIVSTIPSIANSCHIPCFSQTWHPQAPSAHPCSWIWVFRGGSQVPGSRWAVTEHQGPETHQTVLCSSSSPSCRSTAQRKKDHNYKIAADRNRSFDAQLIMPLGPQLIDSCALPFFCLYCLYTNGCSRPSQTTKSLQIPQTSVAF